MSGIPSPSSTQATCSLWHSPTLIVTRFTLRSYMCSGWLLVDLVFIWFLYATFFFEFGGGVAYFYGTVGQGLGLLAILGTAIMAHRALKVQMYLPLSRLSSRSIYMSGIILAAGVLRVFSLLLMLMLALSYHTHSPNIGIQGATFANMLPGALGLLLNSLILSTLTVVLSIPVATRRLQILFLAWLAAVLYSTGSGSAIPYFSIIRLPLTPLFANYALGITPTLTGYNLLMLLIAAGYITGMALVANILFKRRDLHLQ